MHLAGKRSLSGRLEWDTPHPTSFTSFFSCLMPLSLASSTLYAAAFFASLTNLVESGTLRSSLVLPRCFRLPPAGLLTERCNFPFAFKEVATCNGSVVLNSPHDGNRQFMNVYTETETKQFHTKITNCALCCVYIYMCCVLYITQRE